MARVIRRLGGAGTGKTTAQLADMTLARKELGLAPEQIGATTFTRNGRQVMAERAAAEWGCSVESLTRAGYFRTVHSIAMKQIGVSTGQLLTGSSADMAWVSEATGADLTVGVDENDEPVAKTQTTDSREAALAINAWNLARSTLTPLADVIDQAVACGDSAPACDIAKTIIERYETAKRLQDRVDFHDLLCRFAGITTSVDGFGETIPEGEVPEQVRAWFFDEAQDASALVDRACRRLASAPQVERVLISGDAFQSVFGFGGSDYRHFLSWDATQEIMPRSYRCPAEVMAFGERCLIEMNEGYFDRQIAPAGHEGSVESTGAREDAIGSIDLNEPTLILGRCNFILPDFVKLLDAKELPWRLLKADQSSALSGFQALWMLQHGEVIDNGQWTDAIQLFPGSLLATGEKEAWKDGRRANIDFIRPIPEDLELAGCSADLGSAIRAGDWSGLLMPKFEKLAPRWIASARRHGPELATNPKIALATVHAAKGAEGDTVILATETSKRIERSRRLSPERHDEECRIAYVGVTRARKRLIVVEDSARHRMNLPL